MYMHVLGLSLGPTVSSKLIGPQASPVSISPEMGVGTSLRFAFPMGTDRGRGSRLRSSSILLSESSP